jgi:hypothetical protein
MTKSSLLKRLVKWHSIGSVKHPHDGAFGRKGKKKDQGFYPLILGLPSGIISSVFKSWITFISFEEIKGILLIMSWSSAM